MSIFHRNSLPSLPQAPSSTARQTTSNNYAASGPED
jgi:hypothetical protein